MNQTRNKSLTVIDRLRAYLELMRPANIVTAFADILAGFAAVGGSLGLEHSMLTVSAGGLGWLLLSTFGLYGGGVVFNDVFDAELDAKERPERAIPSGRVSVWDASLLGTFLLLIGVFAAFRVNIWSGSLAILIVLFVIVYDAWAKHSVIGGPLLMGLCRGGNLLLGGSLLPLVIFQLWYLALIPIVYIASITLISQGEVQGGTRSSGFFALGLILLVTFSLFVLGLLPGYTVLTASPFIFLFAIMVIPPFFKAARTPSSHVIKKAIKRGVLSLIILDSAIVAGFGGILFGIVTLSLLLVSMLIAKLFSVT